MLRKNFTIQDAKKIGNELGILWDKFDVDQFRRGLNIEFKDGPVDVVTNISNDDLIVTGKIALKHLNKIPDYYDRLEK